MNENSTAITYDKVRSDANTIRDCAATMNNIFESFNSSMKRVGAEDVFCGDASESLGARYNSLKTKFDSYIQLVNEFADMITGAALATEQTEKSLANNADQLAG